MDDMNGAVIETMTKVLDPRFGRFGSVSRRERKDPV